MKMALKLIKNEQDDAKFGIHSLAPSTADKAVRAANQLHSAWCECDSREQKIFFKKFGQLTVMEVIRLFGENDDASAELEPKFGIEMNKMQFENAVVWAHFPHNRLRFGGDNGSEE